MKFIEKLLYPLILFIFVYVVVSLGLRLFQITDSYTSHMVGGVAATVLGVLLFMLLILRKQSK